MSSWARSAMVSTSTPLAVQAGLWALAEGGSAVDAAIAADAVLGVTQPFWTGIGGDAFCLIDDGREVVGFNGSGASPAALTLEACRAARAGVSPTASAPDAEAEPTGAGARGADFVAGIPDTHPLAVTVPGVVDAWAQLMERYGRLGLKRVLEPARSLAAAGFPVGRLAARAWRGAAGRLRPGSGFPTVVRSGERLTNPALAASLETLARGGRDAHYEGRWAEEVARVVGAAGGVMTVDDLAAHRGEWTVPIAGAYRGFEILQHPPNGQGAAVLGALARLDAQPPGRPEDPETLVRVVAAVREGMRAAHAVVGDPRHVTVPEFWAERDTVYCATVAGGMAVSFISSVFWQFGSGLVAGGAVLQNRGAGFSLDPGHPNAAAPRRRPFHTIIPGLVRNEGRTWAVHGVVGGPMQPQGQVQVLAQLIDHGRDPQAALDAPRCRWLGGDVVGLEEGFGPEVPAALEAAGFAVLDRPLPPAELGAGQVIRVHADSWLEGGADRRRDGVAFGS